MSRELLLPAGRRSDGPLLAATLAPALEGAIAVILLVFVSAVPVSLLLHALGSIEAAAGPARIVGFVTYVLAGMGLFLRRRLVRWLAWPILASGAMVFLALISAFWSLDPGLTLRRSIPLIGTIAAGIYLATYPPVRLARMTATAMLILALLGLAAAVLAPSVGRMVETHFGAYRGLWAHKNLAGITLAVGFAGAGFLVLSGRLYWLGAAAVFLGLALWTDSSTGLVCFAAVLGAIGLGWVVRRGPAAAVGVSAIGVSAGLTALVLGPSLISLAADALGRDLTFTGRTLVWSELHALLDERPLGFGFGAFWDTAHGPVGRLNANVGYAPGSAHNGWIDAWVHFGLPGVALLAAMSGLALAQAIWALPRHAGAIWALAILAVALASSTSESMLARPDTIVWTLFLAVTISVSNAAHCVRKAPQ